MRRPGVGAPARGEQPCYIDERLVAEGLRHLFQPDTLLPLQFLAAQRQSSQVKGERRLIVAILEDAIDCFQKHLTAKDVRSRQLWQEARDWLLSDDSSWPFSYLSICEALDIHPSFLRRGILSWSVRSAGRSASVPADRTEEARLITPSIRTAGRAR